MGFLSLRLGEKVLRRIIFSVAQAGIVTLSQRFGSALNLNIHRHMIILDGVYTADKSGKAKFHRVKAPNQKELPTLLNRYRTPIRKPNPHIT
jgi:hypothetical protein